jgi:membrane protein DedA with SNARE-associated domain/rhodanese-related sulfurtransferase
MESFVSAISQHGYSILFVVVFLEAIGLPVPAALALLMAGGASAKGPLHLAETISISLAAMLTGDILMYTLGRYTGWWLLGVLCRLSVSPESCILRSADAFYKRGRMVLVFAKFVPGINTLAPPLAGSMKMRVPQFLAFDLGGASLYALVYLGVGYLFSDFLAAITKGYTRFGNYVSLSIAVLFVGYIAYRAVLAFRDRKRGTVTRIRALEVGKKHSGAVIFDVRSHGYYEKNSMRIKGSTRLEPNALNQALFQLPTDKEIVLYCTCVREATSVKVARELAERGFSVSVIVGGLRAWKKAGLPLELVPLDEVVHLPTFS